MSLVLTVVHVMACLVLIVVVLLQRGKGAEMGAVFGGGGSNTVFGSRGAASFLSKLTTWCTAIFFITSLSLAYIASRSQTSLFHGVKDSSAASSQPATGSSKATTSDAKAGGEFTEVPASAPTTEGTPSPSAETSAAPSGEPGATAPDTTTATDAESPKN